MLTASIEQLTAAARVVYQTITPTPQYRWPLLEAHLGFRAWVKHENHLALGAFKMRGGLTYMAQLRQQHPQVQGLVTATRGNHGQSIAYAAQRQSLPVRIVVPQGNSREKNAAMLALGAELIVHGEDFDAASAHAASMVDESHVRVPSFHPDLVFGVASYWLEFFHHARDLDAVLVPIGLGSGICAAILARNALGLCTPIIGVVSEHAPAYALSYQARQVRTSPARTALADGVAVGVPNEEALALILKNVDDVLMVNDAWVAEAMRQYFRCTHNVAEGAAAVPLAAALCYRERFQHRCVGLPLTGGNVDREVFAQVLAAPMLEG